MADGGGVEAGVGRQRERRVGDEDADEGSRQQRVQQEGVEIVARLQQEPERREAGREGV